MKLLLGLLIGLVCFTAQAKEETATGYGGSFNEAEQSAKSMVTEQAAGTFIASKQIVTNGSYKQVIAQYNGGFIKTYKVTNVLIKGDHTPDQVSLYAVTIQADVDVDKLNRVIESTGADVSAKNIIDVNKVIEEDRKVAKTWGDLSLVNHLYVTKITSSTYLPYGGEIHAVLNVQVQMNPKWYNDAEILTKAIKVPWAEDHLPTICFQQVKSGHWCASVPTIPSITNPRKIVVVIHSNNGSTFSRTFASRIGDGDGPIFAGNAIIDVKDDGWFKPVYTVQALLINEDLITNTAVKFTMDPEAFKNIKEITIELI